MTDANSGPPTTEQTTADTEGDNTPPKADESKDGEDFSLLKAFGGWGGLLDAGLPGIAFVASYTLLDHNLKLAIIFAVSLGVVLAVVRLIRKDPLQNIIGGFVGIGIAAWIAHKTGEARNFYLPGLFINAGYAAGYLLANLVRWPLIGIAVGFAAGWGTEWRKDPLLMRAFLRTGWIWVAYFLLKLAVQLPLYLTDQLVALGVVRVAGGWPLLLVVLYLNYVVVKASVPKETFAKFKAGAEALAEKRKPGSGGGTNP
ncbi:DUF3159 domain-containing protein [Tenggerimyces flavus]|uniref:DUF3159 domain-containing protein n=1 Tax=Tenggerimyces flavus TaxID=1708749 RepID=A0ABV7YJF0_9ACTN|nr:DUF3159 domain-containing protein [Tenggerimyces flavus]MBM7787711.1 hypothetical protein [Tenggerimyces flavus]